METTMPTYTAEFRTDADYAYCAFDARSPEDALKHARASLDDCNEELFFERYDDTHTVNRSRCATPTATRLRCGKTTNCACASRPAICWKPWNSASIVLPIWRGSTTARLRSAP
jgi:hypothetical protein